jgi:RNA polymerase sigma-70 factor (sigma-E family)
MSDAGEFAGLEEFLAERGSALLGTAVLLAGSREAGEDLLQVALERMLRRWQRIDGNPEGYLRRTLYHLAVDRWRWRSRHPELGLTADCPMTGDDPAGAVDLRDALLRALALLPARQRAVLVLRYFEQLSEAEIAAAVGCSAGAVKSSAARGLRHLRAHVASWEPGDASERRTLAPNGAKA